ncbi:MAG: hypothetical protein COB59_09510 [Rhodospirillaceae bacterium]|nr:MAG: hypothetical protein COB59_09510 [Rhodospirillaceae bacterium]
MNTHKCIDTIDKPGLSVDLSLTWQGWILDGKSLVKAEVSRGFPTFVLWRHRQVSRRQLSRLDDSLLKDIGLTHEQARLECQKPFWKA